MFTEEDWQTAQGERCSECGREVFRVIDGLCVRCGDDKALLSVEEQEDRAMRRYYARELRQGTISLREMREGRLAQDTRR